MLSTASLAALSGCLGNDQEDKAEAAIEGIEENLDVADWSLDDEEQVLNVEYQTTGSLGTDVERVALDYADAVDDGLEYDLEAHAIGASNDFSWTVDVEIAQEYLDDELTDEEFVSSILD